MRRIIQRLQSLFAHMPAARNYFRQHGLRQTIIRVFDAIVRSPQHDSVVALNRWLDNDAPRAPAPPAISPIGLAKPCIALIGALDLPQCKKYRVVQKIEQLNGQYDCRVIVSAYQDVPRSFDAMQLATSVLLYRVPKSDILDGYLKEAQRLGLQVIYDIDDPIFSRAIYQANANLSTLAKAEKVHLLNDTQNYLAAMRSCDAVTVSTPGMLDAAREYVDCPVYLWRNAIDEESQAIVAEVLSNTPTPKDSQPPLTLGYMSGSRAHDLDLESIARPLARVLEQHQEVKLVLAGHCSLPPALIDYKDRIVRKPFSNYRGYFESILNVDIVLIPLLTDSFNACKSAIRFLEAGMLRKPCVISAVGDFLNIANDTQNARLAYDEDDWVAALSDLLLSPELRTRLGQNARDHILSTQTAGAIAGSLNSTLIEQLTGGRHG